MAKSLSNGLQRTARAMSLLWPVTAAAAAPQVPCVTQQFDGVTVCAVDMASYATNPRTGQHVCPNTVTTTARAAVCEESFAAAIADAKIFFNNAATHARTYLIGIDAGAYDFTAESQPLAGQKGAIDVSGISPGGTGCLQPGAPQTGIVKLSGSGCLVISGSGATITTLRTAPGMATFFGTNVSHLVVENMTMAQPVVGATQGLYVTSGVETVQGWQYATVTLDVPPGFPTPLQLFQIACAQNGAAGCGAAGLSTLNNIYMRAYTSGASPQAVASTSQADPNRQLGVTQPAQNTTVMAAIAPMQPDPVSMPGRWTVVLSHPQAQQATPQYYGQQTNGVPNQICLKIDSGQAFWFGDSNKGGDLIMNAVIWRGSTRGSFRGVTSALNGSWLGGQVYNSAMLRSAGANGVTPCLSSQGGGLQFGQPGDPPVFGNVVYGFQADATADDTIAMFNDIGGLTGANGVTYPRSMILQSSISNSFARNINLVNVPQYSGFTGNSPVYIDQTTLNNLITRGNCDPLLNAAGGTVTSCPVRYGSS